MNIKIQKRSLVELIIIILILMDSVLLLTIIFYDLSNRIVEIISLFDLVVCIVIAIDYTFRLNKANIKKDFVKSNWMDLIAMLPDVFLNSIFSLFGLSGFTVIVRLFRLVRVARVLVLLRKDVNLFTEFIKETHLDKLLTIVSITIICSSVAFYFFDNSINTFMDSLWYVLVTLTTVGYGDIVPTSTVGRIIGIIIIIIGILVFSTLTAAISSIYTKRIEKKQERILIKD